MAKESVLNMLKKPLAPASIPPPAATDPNASLYWIIKEAKDEARRAAEERISAIEKRANDALAAAEARVSELTDQINAERERASAVQNTTSSVAVRIDALDQRMGSLFQQITEALGASLTTSRSDVGQMAELVRKVAGIEAMVARAPKPQSIKMPEFPALTVDIVSRDMNRDIKQLNIKPKT